MNNFSDEMIDLQTTFRHTFEPELVEEIQSKSKIVELSAGETILEIGQTVRTMPIIIEGNVKVSRGRFNELLKTIDQIAFQKLDERLIVYLKEESKHSGSSLINLSHQQIADELATSRVVILRLLKKLENDGRVLLFWNQVKILNGL